MLELIDILPKPAWSLKPTKPQINEWAIGVTTAPRKEPTLEKCIAALEKAGWGSPRVFAEPNSVPPIRDWSNLFITHRNPKLGAWANYYLGLWELVVRQPDADAYMVVQDDALFYDGENVREYLESFLWPRNTKVGAVSLYCPSAYTQSRPGWHRFDPEDKWVWGALAFAWPRATVYQFLTSYEAVMHQQLANVDGAIGKWLSANLQPLWYCCPSLVQHIGTTSAIQGGEALDSGRRHADRFVGDLSNERTIW